jgi:hypothetical protein
VKHPDTRVRTTADLALSGMDVADQLPVDMMTRSYLTMARGWGRSGHMSEVVYATATSQFHSQLLDSVENPKSAYYGKTSIVDVGMAAAAGVRSNFHRSILVNQAEKQGAQNFLEATGLDKSLLQIGP